MKQLYFKYLLALLLFGSNGIVASFINLNSYEIVFLRTLIGSIFLIIVFILSKQQLQCLKNKKHLLLLLVSGAAMGVSWMFLYEAYTTIGVSLATLTYYCGPGIVIMLSPLLFKERITWIRMLGFGSVLLGLFLVNRKDLMAGDLSWGFICGILSAIMYAAMVIFNKKAIAIKGLENSMLQLVSSFIVVAIFTLSKQGIAITLVLENLMPILILGVVNTGIGCYLYFSSIQGLSASSVAITGYLEPLSALVFSSIFLQERLMVVQWVGAILILGGAIVGEQFHPLNNKKYNLISIKRY